MKKEAKTRLQGLSHPAKELESVYKARGCGETGNCKEKNEIWKAPAVNSVENGFDNWQ